MWFLNSQRFCFKLHLYGHFLCSLFRKTKFLLSLFIILEKYCVDAYKLCPNSVQGFSKLFQRKKPHKKQKTNIWLYIKLKYWQYQPWIYLVFDWYQKVQYFTPLLNNNTSNWLTLKVEEQKILQEILPQIISMWKQLLSTQIMYHHTWGHTMWWMNVCRDGGHDLYILHHQCINNAPCSSLLSTTTMFHTESRTTAAVHSPTLAHQLCLSTSP